MLPVAESVAGVCIVRDARDLIPLVCGHYLRIGFGHVAFIDDGSSDGTFEFLSRLTRRTQRVSVKRVVEDQFNQRAHVTKTANALIAAGYAIIVPFDVDELWCVEARGLEELLATQSDIAFNGKWANFVQRRKRLLPRPFNLFGMTFRAPGLADANRATVTEFLRPFVSYVEKKVAFKTNSAVEVSLGQHVLLSGPDKFCDKIFEIFHLPIRSRCEIEKRGLNYEPRWAKIRTDPGENWQSAFHHEIVLAGKTDAVWAANSADRNGCLDVYGTPQELTRDDRLRHLLILAATHLLAHFRTWAL
jgi:Glycosyl transferase family 2